MKKLRLTLLICVAALLIVAVTQVIKFNNYQASLPRIHTAKKCDDGSWLKVRVSDAQLKLIAGRAFYVKPVDTFDWKNKCRGTQGTTIVYEPSKSANDGTPVSICE